MACVSGKFLRKVVQHDFYDTADQVSAVLLLNSPSNSAWEYEEYLRLLRMRRYLRQSEENSEAKHVCRCYFICSDGAYPRLCEYVRQKQEGGNHLPMFSSLPLCDAVVGDMDSYGGTPYSGGCNGVEFSEMAPANGYATVDDIPFAELDHIREKILISVARFHRLDECAANESKKEERSSFKPDGDESSILPLWLHVRCQETTDFDKALRLISRLRERYPNDVVVLPAPLLNTLGGVELLRTGGEINPDADGDGIYLDHERERKLCEDASAAEALLMPTYVALGALGGRMDHEFAAISTILSYYREAHVVLTNNSNTIFACQPNGWTQVVWQPRYETSMCGLINFGEMKECETSGLRWNVVSGRRDVSGSQDTVFMFGTLISACNQVRREVVTVDLRCGRPLSGLQNHSAGTQEANEITGCKEQFNPLVVFIIERRNKPETLLCVK